jgi:hypothetical protein
MNGAEFHVTLKAFAKGLHDRLADKLFAVASKKIEEAGGDEEQENTDAQDCEQPALAGSGVDLRHD